MNERQLHLLQVLANGDLGLATNAPRVAEHLGWTRKGAARTLESLERRRIVVEIGRSWDERFQSDYHVYMVQQRRAASAAWHAAWRPSRV